MKIANKDTGKYAGKKEPFVANNLSGIAINKKYIIYSYGWYPLYICDRHGIWYENTTKYSITTSKHKSQSHPWGSGKIIPKTHKQLKKIFSL